MMSMCCHQTTNSLSPMTKAPSSDSRTIFPPPLSSSRFQGNIVESSRMRASFLDISSLSRCTSTSSFCRLLSSCWTRFCNREWINVIYLLIYLFIEGVWSSQPHRVTSGLFTRSNQAQVEYNTTHARCINVKYTNIIRN